MRMMKMIFGVLIRVTCKLYKQISLFVVIEYINLLIERKNIHYSRLIMLNRIL